MIIKFRAKEKGTSQWQFWDYPHQQMPPLHIEFSTVGQFVNIYDVDKNEIYVGDILEDELNRRWIVFDAPGGFCVCTIEESSETNNNPIIYSALGEPQNVFWTAQNCKVIGNRYDHPELLAGGKMKIRQDFVTNSSSSSFLICKENLDNEQLDAIRNNYEMGRRLNIDWVDGSWNIEENELFITGYTIMDNYCIGTLFDIIGIKDSDITWGEFPFSLNVESKDNEEEPIQNKKEWREILEDIKNGVPFDAEDDLDRLLDELED